MSETRTPADFYALVDTAVPEVDARLEILLSEYRRFRAVRGRSLRILDVGCGRLAVLSHHIAADDDYCGCDIADLEEPRVRCFRRVDLNAESLVSAFAGEVFDVIFCGEVIEHVFSPDALMEDVKALLDPEGLLLLSTPNLAYWVNRLLLLAGISPLFLENSSRKKLGRFTRFLGQGNRTEGHIRVFTYRAMRELLDLHGFELLKSRPAPVWEFFLPDRVICRISASLAPDVVYVARCRAS
jgi:SAM-dependent methyltransferase